MPRTKKGDEELRLTVFDRPLGSNGRPDFNNSGFREKLIELAVAGMSDRGVAKAAGIGYDMLRTWISMGKAEPHIEPHGSFARRFEQALRAKEVLATHVIHVYQKRVAELADDPRAEAEDLLPHIGPMLKIMNHALPEDWGESKHRQVQGEITGDEFFQGKALTVGQIRGALRNPERAMKEALVAEGDAVVAGLLEGGWSPSPEMVSRLKAILDPVD